MCPHNAVLSRGVLFSQTLDEEHRVQREFKPKERPTLILTGLNTSTMVAVPPVLGVCMFLKTHIRTSLVVQWLPMQGAQVRSLVRELDPTCC